MIDAIIPPSRAPLLVRVDASPKIGAGHLMRCLALAEAWRTLGGRVTFVVDQAGMPWKDRLLSTDHSNIWLEGLNDARDLAATISVGRQIGADWLVLDGYHFTSGYQQGARAAGLRVLLIDDVAHDAGYSADILLNQNIGTERRQYRVASDTQLLLGPRYALLRPEFSSWRGWKRRIVGLARRVLVTLGGSDPEDLTRIVVDVLREFSDLDVLVLLGAGYRGSLDGPSRPSKEGKTMRYLQEVRNMAEVMAWADLAISASGSTTWELAFMGLPSLLLNAAPNQEGIALALHNRGIAESVDISVPGAIAGALRGLMPDVIRRSSMSARGRELVDGDGAIRVARAILGERTLG